MKLEDSDLVLIPPVESRVEISGPVRRPGLFEIKSDENLDDLLKRSCGLN